jgi:hypothetical protein
VTPVCERSRSDRTLVHVPGRGIVRASWASVAFFAVTAIPAASGVDAFAGIAIGISLALFAASLVAWTWAFAIAVVRSANGDDVVVANMFFTVGDAPKEVRRQLFAALGVSLLVAAGTVAGEPFGALVPMLPLGFVGLWAARHGSFPRRPEQRRR